MSRPSGSSLGLVSQVARLSSSPSPAPNSLCGFVLTLRARGITIVEGVEEIGWAHL